MYLLEQSDVKGKIENSVKAGGCHVEIHIKNYNFNFCVC